MQNERSFDVAPDPSVQQGTTAGSPPPQEVPLSVAPPPQGTPIPPRAATYTPPAQARRSLWRFITIGVGVVLVLVGGVIALITQLGRQQQVQSGEYSVVKLPLANFAGKSLPVENATSLKVNGQLDVSQSIRLTPSTQPVNPQAGQIYFDQTSSKLMYYDGQQFVAAGGSSTTVNNTTNAGGATTNVTNVLGGSGNSQFGVELQASAPGTQQVGNFNVSGTGQVGNLKTSLINPDNGNLVIKAPNFAVQNAAGQNMITSAPSGIAVTTAPATGVTGDITIKSGDSSTTASGDVTIDAGSGFVSGTVVGNKTFEGGLDNMAPWFGSTIAQTSAQAHTGTESLQMTTTGGFWGVIENVNNQMAPAVPGHSYHFSLWVRAATAPRTVGATIVWNGGASTVPLQSVVDSTTGWIEMTGNGVAPAGTTGAYWEVSGSGTAAGEVHYFDDMVITDLSSSSATSVLNLGNTNAQIVNIGNMNQIGATTIKGGSGVDIQSGQSGINLNGGAITITGSAASTLSTSGGALTINSATTASWGVSTASSGVGGNLTLHAGNGSAGGANNGGDLVLQGGNQSGGGIGGSVVVKPQADSAQAFQVQNSTGTQLLVADTLSMKISVKGTTTTFASLTLADAHFASTQTNPPTIGTPTNCGAGATAAVTAGSTDTAGSFAITTGTGGTSSTCDTVFTFNKAYGAAPKSIIVVGKSDAASAARQAYVISSNATTFTLSFGTSAAGANSTAYSFSYWIIE